MWKETHSGELPREMPSPWGAQALGRGARAPGSALGVNRENPRVRGEKGALVLSQRLLKTQGSFSVSNKSRASHTNHLELPVGIQ